MRKALYLILALLMIINMSSVAFADIKEAEGNVEEIIPEVVCNICNERYAAGTDHSCLASTITGNPTSAETPISYTGQGTENYTVTVPASLSPGGTAGTVKIEDTWASDKVVKVEVPDKTVTLTNNISGADTKDVTVNFEGISKVGSNVASVEESQTISVSEVSNALFGTWTGTIEFSVSLEDAVELISFTIDGKSYQAEEGMTWGEWVDSEYNTQKFILSGGNIADGNNILWEIADEPNGRHTHSHDEIIAGYSYLTTTHPEAIEEDLVPDL